MKQIVLILLASLFGWGQLLGQTNKQDQKFEDPEILTIEGVCIIDKPSEASIYSINDLIVVQTSSEKGTQSMFQLRRNSVFVEFFIMYPGIGYSRIFPIKPKIGLVVAGAITPWWDWLTELEGGIILGKNKHFFEPVAGYWFAADNAYLKLGYRYQAAKGFMLRISPAWSFTESFPMWTFSIGYSF